MQNSPRRQDGTPRHQALPPETAAAIAQPRLLSPRHHASRPRSHPRQQQDATAPAAPTKNRHHRGSTPSPPTRDARRTGTRTNNATDQRRPQGEARRRTTNSIPGSVQKMRGRPTANLKGCRARRDVKGCCRQQQHRSGERSSRRWGFPVCPSPSSAANFFTRLTAQPRRAQRVAMVPRTRLRCSAERVCWKSRLRRTPSSTGARARASGRRAHASTKDPCVRPAPADCTMESSITAGRPTARSHSLFITLVKINY
mmetsp:Transcript_29861/g.63407  ORF Transcript_29861/g.63407 Transcript_29861/m.63407 type:complete len:256 (+) Transcript_29861:542-1309(+)